MKAAKPLRPARPGAAYGSRELPSPSGGGPLLEF